MITFEYHPDLFALWPCLLIGRYVCEDCEEEEGWVISLSWLIWAVHFPFGFGGHE